MTTPTSKPLICLGIERADGTFAIIEKANTQITPTMQAAAEALLHTLTTGEPQFPGDFYDLVARAFHTNHQDAKARLLKVAYGGKTAP